MRNKAEVNLSAVKTPAGAQGYTRQEAVAEAMRCLDCPAEYCRKDCPIATPVPEMCRRIRQEDFAGAYEILQKNNPLSSMSCRVCPWEKQCEKDCTRAIRGEAVNIGALERFVNDWQKQQGLPAAEKAPECGLCAAVVGSGPSGLACAMELASAGWSVTVYEAGDRVGGVPRWGIPDFSLPPEVTGDILARAEALGVEFITGKALGRELSLEQLRKDHDAVYLALGAPVPVSGGFEEAMQAQYLLHEASLGRDPVMGRSVAVIGGGDTAIDAVRVARRLGAADVKLIYRRGPEEMPARREDVKAAEEEGVGFLWWTEPAEISGGTLRCRRTEKSAPDYPGGRANAVSCPGTEFNVEADVTVLALGFGTLPVEGLSCDGRGRILADEQGATALPGVYAGGDAVSGPSTVVRAAAAGKAAARAILAKLKEH